MRAFVPDDGGRKGAHLLRRREHAQFIAIVAKEVEEREDGSNVGEVRLHERIGDREKVGHRDADFLRRVDRRPEVRCAGMIHFHLAVGMKIFSAYEPFLVVEINEGMAFPHENAAAGMVELDHMEVLRHGFKRVDCNIGPARAQKLKHLRVDGPDLNRGVGSVLCEASDGFPKNGHDGVVDAENSHGAAGVGKVEGVAAE